jgi:hypothetical protein
LVIADTFENLLSESDMSLSELAEAIRIPKSQLSAFLSSGGKKTIDFIYFIRAVRLIRPNHEEEFMKQVCPCLLRPQNLRVAMEYAATFNYYDLQRVLYDINVGMGRENKDFAEAYKIYLDFQEKTKSNEELFEELESYSPKYLETRLFKLIIQCSLYYRERNYKEMHRCSTLLYKEIGQVKNEYLRESYMSRICDIIARTYLFYKNDVKKARFFAGALRDNEFSAKRKIHSLYIYGMSYFYDDYEKSLTYLKQYRDELKAIGNSAAALTIDNKEISFLKNQWDQHEGFHSNDPAEMAHYYAKIGESEKAVEILDTLGSLTPFQHYYKGLATNNPESLSISFVEFMRKGERFFAALPKNELNKYENYGFFAELLYNKTGNIF